MSLPFCVFSIADRKSKFLLKFFIKKSGINIRKTEIEYSYHQNNKEKDYFNQRKDEIKCRKYENNFI